jgi:hypothetical protein
MNELSQLRAIANRYTNRYAINTDVFKAIRARRRTSSRSG